VQVSDDQASKNQVASRAQSLLNEVTKALPGGGERREGQEQMMVAVANAIMNRRHLVVQAGTGTGKSLAYLLPAALAERPVVISTATKALQDQILAQDLPLVAESISRDLTYTVLKGRTNYACWSKLVDLEHQGLQAAFDEVDDRPSALSRGRFKDQIEKIMAWAQRSSSGDRADLADEPDEKVWQMVSMTPQDCPGAAKCDEAYRCFTETARARAASSDIVVVNTALYGSHLSSGKALLPDHDVVIFDEAHELEDIFSTSLGTELSPARFHRLVQASKQAVGKNGTELLIALDLLGDELEGLLADREGQRVLEQGADEALRNFFLKAEAKTKALIDAVRAEEETPSGLMKRQSAIGSATQLVGDLQRFGTCGDDEVAWISGVGRRRTLELAPIDLGPTLAKLLWGEVTAVLTSATIPSNVGARLGMAKSDVDVVDVGSPFNYGEQAMLYVAKHLPSRNDPAAEPAIIEELVTLINAAGGRTLALFTSKRFTEIAAAAVRQAVNVPILVQGEAPKNRLLEQFRDDHATCLFATMGFWQGVDLPGDTLRLVTIDRLPFNRPDDPLLNARRDRAGDNAFMSVDVPRAAALLAQGAGRLIRSATDKGVVAVFDSRLATAQYRHQLLAEFPPMHRTITTSEVVEFLESLSD
jgi:ATP-dependent DNA helicase DinG